VALLPWGIKNLPRIWQAVRQADAVHAPIPGDIGTIGILVALIQRKPLFVRYCGRWGKKETLAERFWHWLLIRIAGGRNVVLATGGGRERPAPQNPAIDWIFSTSMSREDLERLPPKQLWHRGEVLRLITVGRQETGKNTDLILRALPAILRHYPRTTLDVVGDGSQLLALQQLAERLDLVELVTFHGNVSHQRVLSLLTRAHLFVFPTDSEGFPKAVHEALACSLPVVTTGVSVLPYLIGDHNCGLLLSEKTPVAIAEAVTHLIETEQQFWRMAERAQITAQAYSLEAWRDTIGDALQAAWGPLQEDAA
jgi:glycosyltransferase involved in cell wall biosynthesis